MNDQHDLERLVADSVRSIGPLRPSDGAHELTASRVRQSRQNPEWLALIKEPPMRSNSLPVVGSPTVRVAALMAATLLLILALAAAGAGARQLLASDGAIIVAADGSGDHSTIQAAMDAAGEDAIIKVKPGMYVEAVLLERGVSLIGDGDRDSIVVTAPDDGPRLDTGFQWLGEQPYALAADRTVLAIENMTLRGTDSRLFIGDEGPAVAGMLFDGVGEAPVGGVAKAQAIIVTGGNPTIRDNVFRGGGGINGFGSAMPVVERNRFEEGPAIFGDFGDGGAIRDNVFEGPGLFAIRLGEPAGIVIEANRISGRDSGIDSVNGIGPAIIRANHIDGATRTAIEAQDVDGASVRRNVISDSVIGISWSGSDGFLSSNIITGGTTGIIVSAGTPVVRDNTVSGAENRGMMISPGASPRLEGNTLCDNGTNLFVVDGAEPEIDETNEICQDAESG